VQRRPERKKIKEREKSKKKGSVSLSGSILKRWNSEKREAKKKLKKLPLKFALEKEEKHKDKFLNHFRERSKSMPPMSSPLLSSSSSISLADILDTERGYIPEVVNKTISFLSNENVYKTEGLFRVAGNSNEIDNLWKVLEEGGSVPDDTDVHTVASVLKRFFRQLSEPLFTYDNHKVFLEATDSRSPEEVACKMKGTIAQLPRANQNTIRELFTLLKKVSEYSTDNKMHSVNLGIMFGPTLMRDPAEATSMGVMFDNRNEVVTNMLDHYDFIFGDNNNNNGDKSDRSDRSVENNYICNSNNSGDSGSESNR